MLHQRASTDLLPRCPFCGYRLDGLPTEHRCPECGRDVDRRWQVFGGKKRWSSLSPGRRLQHVCVTIVCIGLLSATRWLPSWLLLIAVLVLLAVTIGLISRPSLLVAIGPRGMTIYRRDGTPCEHFDWRQVNSAHVGGHSGAVFYVDNKPREFDAWAGNLSEAQDCVDAVTDHLHKHGRP